MPRGVVGFRLSPGNVKRRVLGTSMDAWMPLPSLWGLIPNTSCGFKRVTSADHTSFEAGENVAASTSGSTTVFDDNFRSGAENNPHSITLDEEQLSISAALFFEDAVHFTLEMFNLARWPRTILLAGITNLQWEEVTTPAPTPLTTPSPTPEPAEATASPTPSPTCVFDLISGDGGAICSCITSPNYPEKLRSRWQLRHQTCVSQRWM